MDVAAIVGLTVGVGVCIIAGALTDLIVNVGVIGVSLSVRILRRSAGGADQR
jgi:hypothetical protein